MKKILIYIFFLVFVACGEGNTLNNTANTNDEDSGRKKSCIGITCSNHGYCKIINNKAMCQCNIGYSLTPNMDDCVYTRCMGQYCNNHGTCKPNSYGTASCECDPGYKYDGGDTLSCIPDKDPPEDPCEGGCSGHGTCDEETGECTCKGDWYGDRCNRFDTGAPWTINVTGDVNETVELKYIHCGAYPDNGKRRVGISLLETKNNRNLL